MTDFGRLITAMVTPFNEKMKVDYQRAKELAEHLAATGSQSIVVAGTTGESPTLSVEEKENLFKTVVDAVKGKARVIAGSGSNSTEQSMEITRKAEAAGVDGVMLVVPYYNKPPQEGLYSHFKMIAESTHLPIMLYNVPGRTSVNLSAQTTIKLAQLDNVFAIKEASGDLEQISQIITETPEDFLVYSGDDSMTLPIMSIGGYGVVSVAGHIIGEKITEMIGAFTSGQPDEAAALHRKLMPIFKGMFISTNPIPVKTALNQLGNEVGPVRLPLVQMTPGQQEELKGILMRAGLL
ncbi:4-hydroxy-tetrahydrodipicolinate synthase [Candidatus Contubernalis alkalaceticus]|uniref:4-hydroxy-tetrahydrodipicolinate synthase n=1 Tax=Candidatus Contubernalis alkaliaceticus TaxID=338645 RepID=UPI002A4E205F|nr:4-hydroxy-tetrahydrodipicolinate synthase [Candidatus Contubernalis alkalaceticus]UNC91853.1 4-hydroxy-tetrahydrodipicolinate synthase [Candidatus Contubernalis alkalaceticus]